MPETVVKATSKIKWIGEVSVCMYVPERSFCTNLRPTNPVAPVMATVSASSPVALQEQQNTSLVLLLVVLAARALKEEGKGRMVAMAVPLLCLCPP
jgi:hypothetical protein